MTRTWRQRRLDVIDEQIADLVINLTAKHPVCPNRGAFMSQEAREQDIILQLRSTIPRTATFLRLWAWRE
jgi:hypothetical protein